MNKKIFIPLFFGCFGIATEILFTSVRNLMFSSPLCDFPLITMAGKSYFWMFFIYALIPFFASFIYNKIRMQTLPVRLITYTIIILLVEFVAGFLLEVTTGQCPWKYEEGFHLMGYVRLDYFPAWMFFSFIVEYLYNYLDLNLN